MLCGICLSGRAAPFPVFIEPVAVGASPSLTNEFLGWLTLYPPGFFVPKQKVVCRMVWPLSSPTLILIFKLNGWGLIPHLQHVIIVFSLQQKSEFNLMAFS